jgi:hypothetical protein
MSAPVIGKLYTTHYLVIIRPKFSAFLQQLWGFVLVFCKHQSNLKALLFNSSRPLLWQLVKVKSVGCFVQYFYPIFFNMLAVNLRFVYNKKIKSPAAQAGTHTRGLLRILAHAPAPLI